ncbi:hypothetical protein D3C72_1898490 [compost metagenome]
MASLFSRMRFSNGASPATEGRLTAPCILMTEPLPASGFRSRRTVSSETPSLLASSATLIVPSRWSSRKMSRCRLDGVMVKPPNMAKLIAEAGASDNRSTFGHKNTKCHKTTLTSVGD